MYNPMLGRWKFKKIWVDYVHGRERQREIERRQDLRNSNDIFVNNDTFMFDGRNTKVVFFVRNSAQT